MATEIDVHKLMRRNYTSMLDISPGMEEWSYREKLETSERWVPAPKFAPFVQYHTKHLHIAGLHRKCKINASSMNR